MDHGLFLSNGEVTLKHRRLQYLIGFAGLFLSNGEVTLKPKARKSNESEDKDYSSPMERSR